MELIANRPLVRERNLAQLRRHGFRSVVWLPLREHLGVCRPAREIAARAMCAAVAFVAGRPTEHADAVVRAHVDRNELESAMLDDERAMLAEPRPDAPAASLDAAWGLAWALGFDEAPTLIGAPPVTKLVRFLFRGGDVDVGSLAARSRPVGDLVAAEDLFTCAHQTARLALLDHPDVHVPDDANPPTIEALRHAFTWCLSPNVAWAATDLTS